MATRSGKWPQTTLAAIALSAIALALTADERVFGLATDGQIMTRTAYSIAELGEIGMARGHPVNRVRPEGDAVTRYGMAFSLVQVPVVWLAGPWERTFGVGSSQTLFVLEQILLVLLAAFAAGKLAEGLAPGAKGVGWRAALLTALGSPLAGYVSSEYSEPLQAALLGGTFACAVAALRATGVEGARLSGAVRARLSGATRARLLAAAAGACAGFGLVARSPLVVLLPLIVGLLFFASPKERRLGNALAGAIGWLPFGALWLGFEIARFGRPFASYQGEHFSHSLLSGLWRLTVGPNKGLFLYFPAALLAVWGFAKLARREDVRLPALGILGIAGFVLVTTAMWWSWDGIGGWGPRLLVSLVPLLSAVAAVASVELPPVAFRVLFGAGALVAALGVLEPSSLNTWYFNVLPRRPLTPEQAAKYPGFVLETDPKTGGETLTPQADVANHATLTELKVGSWLLLARLAGGDVMKTLAAPPWDTSRPGFEVAVPPERAIPGTAIVFLTSPFRWPHLGMSLTRRKDQVDTVLAYVDCVYDQELRAQDRGDGERAVAFAEKLYQMVPGPQTAAELAEAYRMANRREAFVDVVTQMPASQKTSPRFGMVMALYARDVGDPAKAQQFLESVLASAPRPEYARLKEIPPARWPASLREIERPRS